MAMTFEEIQKLSKEEIFELQQKAKLDEALLDPKVCTLLGQCYDFGTPHLKPNKDEAFKLYTLGTRKNYEVAAALFAKFSEDYHLILPYVKSQIQKKIISNAKNGDNQHIFLEGFFRYYGLMGFSMDIPGAKEILLTAKDHMPSKKLLLEIEKYYPSSESSCGDKKESAENTTNATNESLQKTRAAPMDETEDPTSMSMNNSSNHSSNSSSSPSQNAASAGNQATPFLEDSAAFSLLNLYSKVQAQHKRKNGIVNGTTTDGERPKKRYKG